VKIAILQDIVDCGKLGLDVIDLVGAPVPQALIGCCLVDGPRIQMIDTGVSG
jgi:hypothetical protein